VHNCARDEGRSLEVGLHEQVSNWNSRTLFDYGSNIAALNQVFLP
jgi:hypothetical protein